MSASFNNIQDRSSHYGNGAKFLGYGTAGFRDKEVYLDHVLFRMGILAALRSKLKNGTIGVMITASHNPEEDNGAKLVDPKGEMLEQAWEQIATDIANIPSSELVQSFQKLVERFGIDVGAKGSVFVARDTRKSSGRLCSALLDGINCIENCEVVDHGLASTPILHYLVVCKNGDEAYGRCSRDGYFEKISSAFVTAIGKEAVNGNYKPCLTVDCANGIGAQEIKEFEKRIHSALSLKIVNDGTNGVLNENCGADFVKVQQTYPENVVPVAGERFASIDGDADRIMYFYFDGNATFRMLDGDKISLLFVTHLSELIRKARLELNVGVVQTAYANGSSTNYATTVLKVPVACVPTGVKHLHHAAQDFDVGVYFEANGHGTVQFSDKAVTVIKNAAKANTSLAAKQLALFVDIINSTVGDAISDALCVEAILHAKGWSAEDWDKMYTDLPNRQLKVNVADRTVIQTTDAERKCTSPAGLQETIDRIVAKYLDGRSFVRPSGTEDVVRVYAEANTQENADALGKEVSQAVHKMCAGKP